MLFATNIDVSKAFGVDLITSDAMNSALRLWNNVSTGSPPWLNADDGIETVNMAKHISDTRAKLATLDIGIAVDGSARAEYLQGLIDNMLTKLPDRLADADRMGGMVIKWNGASWDYILPGDFGVTAKDGNGNIVGAIFASYATIGRSHFTRLEYHRFEGEGDQRVYKITHRAYQNSSNGLEGNDASTFLGREVELKRVPDWADLLPEVAITNLDSPLFGFYRVPGSNVVDVDSPLGLSVFAGAMTELKAIDIGVSRKNEEVEDSKHITFVGQALIKDAKNKGVTLPRFVKGLGMGLNDTDTSAIHEHAPTLQTDSRIRDLNFDLSMAGVKCGFSEGVFVLDGQTGMITATQIESDDRDTIQTIKNDRDALKTAIDQALKGADALVTLYGLAPLGDYETVYNFGDITYSYEEDKASWRYYVSQGWAPVWMYFVKFEGMSEEDAKAMVATVKAEQLETAMLFGATRSANEGT